LHVVYNAKKKMPEKISRDTCLIKYRNFPLRDFMNKTDDEIFYHPKIYSQYWLRLDHKSTRGLTKKLSVEIPKILENLNVENLIFLSDYNQNWISKFTENRNDYKPLIGAIDYFRTHKVTKQFNGGLKVNIKELAEFIKYFFILTRADGGFTYYHFLDEQQNILGFIHYSGEVCFEVLNNKISEQFLLELNKSEFLNTFRENTNRI